MSQAAVRTEYKVVGKAQASGTKIESPVTVDRERAERQRQEFLGVYRDVQLLTRTVTESPWLEAGEARGA